MTPIDSSQRSMLRIQGRFWTSVSIFTCALSVLLAVSISDAASQWMEGDLIFQKSKSQQASAITEATGSDWSHVGLLLREADGWYVAEAIQPSKLTKLDSFIKRGRSGEYRVYRARGLTDQARRAIRAEAKALLGLPYDIFFEWSDERLYCSELVYRVYEKATGQPVGQLQKFGDLKLDGPYVQALIRLRLTSQGKSLNLEEPIVTPISQMMDSKLARVH